MIHYPVEDDRFWLGYLVALYEGEGSVNTWTPKANPNRMYAKLSVRMTDREPVENLFRAWGGTLAKPYSAPSEKKKGYKIKHRWTVARVDAVLELIRLMLPYMSPRRKDQLQVALDHVEPAMRRRYEAGQRRERRPGPFRPKRHGELVCPTAPEPSVRGYRRHKLLGIPVCDVCLASWKLYYAEKRKWERAAFAEMTPEEQKRIRARQAEYVRASRLRKLQRAADS